MISKSVQTRIIAFFQLKIKNQIRSFGDPAQNALNSSLPSSWRTKLHEVLISKLQLMFKVNRFKITQWVIIYHRDNQLSSYGRKAETHMLTLAVFNNVWLYRQLVNTNLYCMKLRPCRRTLKRILSRNISRDVAKLC